MPAAYAHYRFGKEVETCLPYLYKKTIEKHHELFDIGLHGPDILFYYHPLSSNEINKTGYAMHDIPAASFFEKTAAIWRNSEQKDALKAYLFGFICHFSLDSTCHPYVEKMIDLSKLSHNEIETELERYFMLKDHIEPASYIPIQHIHASHDNSKVIYSCFENLSEADIFASLQGMIRCHKLLHASSSFKRNILYTGLKISGHYDSMQGLIMKPEPDPRCEDYCGLLDKMYTEAVTVAVSLIQQYSNVLEHDVPLSPRFQKTFGAGENWQQLFIA